MTFHDILAKYRAISFSERDAVLANVMRRPALPGGTLRSTPPS